MLFNNIAEFASNWLWTFTRDNAEALVERKTRLDTAHNDVDGIRHPIEKLILTALYHLAQEPPGQTDGANKTGYSGPHKRRRSTKLDGTEQNDASNHA